MRHSRWLTFGIDDVTSTIISSKGIYFVYRTQMTQNKRKTMNGDLHSLNGSARSRAFTGNDRPISSRD